MYICEQHNIHWTALFISAWCRFSLSSIVEVRMHSIVSAWMVWFTDIQQKYQTIPSHWMKSNKKIAMFSEWFDQSLGNKWKDNKDIKVCNFSVDLFCNRSKTPLSNAGLLLLANTTLSINPIEWKWSTWPRYVI